MASVETMSVNVVEMPFGVCAALMSGLDSGPEPDGGPYHGDPERGD